MLKNETFFLTIYQLKNTSDCIKIDPRGPGRNLKKSQKIVKKWPKILKDFWRKNNCFLHKKMFFWRKIITIFGPKFWRFFWTFLRQSLRASLRQSFGRVFGLFEGAPLRGALGRAPPPFCRAETLKNFKGKSVPENYTLFFDKNHVFGHFTH